MVFQKYLPNSLTSLDLDGNKLAKGMCLARKVRDRSVYVVVPMVVNFSVLK